MFILIFLLMCIYLCFVIIHLLNANFSGCIHYLFDRYFTKKIDELELLYFANDNIGYLVKSYDWIEINSPHF